MISILGGPNIGRNHLTDYRKSKNPLFRASIQIVPWDPVQRPGGSGGRLRAPLSVLGGCIGSAVHV